MGETEKRKPGRPRTIPPEQREVHDKIKAAARSGKYRRRKKEAIEKETKELYTTLMIAMSLMNENQLVELEKSCPAVYKRVKMSVDEAESMDHEAAKPDTAR